VEVQRTSFWNTTEVYRRADDRWRIAHTHWSYIDHKRVAGTERTVGTGEREPRAAGVAGDLLALEAGALARWRKDYPAAGCSSWDSIALKRLDRLPLGRPPQPRALRPPNLQPSGYQVLLRPWTATARQFGMTRQAREDADPLRRQTNVPDRENFRAARSGIVRRSSLAAWTATCSMKTPL